MFLRSVLLLRFSQVWRPPAVYSQNPQVRVWPSGVQRSSHAVGGGAGGGMGGGGAGGSDGGVDGGSTGGSEGGWDGGVDGGSTGGLEGGGGIG